MQFFLVRLIPGSAPRFFSSVLFPAWLETCHLSYSLAYPLFNRPPPALVDSSSLPSDDFTPFLLCLSPLSCQSFHSSRLPSASFFVCFFEHYLTAPVYLASLLPSIGFFVPGILMPTCPPCDCVIHGCLPSAAFLVPSNLAQVLPNSTLPFGASRY